MKKYLEHSFLAIFLMALIYSLWASMQGWWSPIMEAHAFRQTQTAMAAYYMAQGGPFWKYELPVFGPPWSVPFEWPLYQWLVAKWSLMGWMPLEQSGRLVGKFFYYLSLWPLWIWLGQMGIARSRRFIWLSIYLLSPLYLFWSRAILIESTALFFGLLYCAYGWRAKGWMLPFVGIVGAIAGVVKVTTFYSFIFVLGLVWLIRERRNLFCLWREVLWLFLLPFILMVAWTKFSDGIKMQNPLAAFTSSGALELWNFGSIEQRLAGSTWYMFFRKVIHDSIGHRTTWILSVLGILGLRLRIKEYWLLSFLFLLAPMTFTNLHIAHNYYWYANGIFLVLAMGFFVDALWRTQKPIWAVAFLLAILGLEVRHYEKEFLPRQLELNIYPHEYGEKLQAVIKPNEVLLIYGSDWFPLIPYYGNRRAIMNRENIPLQDPRMQNIFSQMRGSPYKLGAVLLCGKLIGDQNFLNNLRQEMAITKDPELRGLCDVYPLRGEPKG